MERIVITGGAGFLGSNIARGLIEKGDEVAIVDICATPRAAKNLNDMGIDSEPVKGDLKSYEFAKEALKGFDMVYHFAAEVGSVAFLHGSKANQLAVMQANMVIDTNVFRACMENGVRKIIYPSSAAVYPTNSKADPNRLIKEEDSESNVSPE
jgi:nucleoside-diphosphate-sugar epimerase